MEIKKVVLILSMPIHYIVHGWVTSVLWKLFVSPVFNVPNLSIVQAIGITLTWSFLSCSPSMENGIEKLQEKLIPSYDKWECALENTLKGGILLPLFVVGMGCLVAYFL